LDILHYVTESNEDIYQEWLDGLRDRATRVGIQRRVDRLTLGNFGDHKACRDGVWELRIDFGPGYRIYYSQSGKEIVLLLCGGSKRTQASDIDQAVIYWQDYQRRLK
jgi:putative addiction module killer protein